MPPGAEIIVHRCTIKIKNELLGLYAIRFLFYLLSNRVTNIVEILVVLDVIRLKFESGARESGGGGGRGRGGRENTVFPVLERDDYGKRESCCTLTKQKPLKISGLFSQKNKLKKL